MEVQTHARASLAACLIQTKAAFQTPGLGAMMKYGKFKRKRSLSPSNSASVKAALAQAPHADLIPPPDLTAIETARRAEVSNEARELFHDGLLAHEVLERYPHEAHWMTEKVGEWEVVFRREQLAFVEGLDKPAPKFNAPKPKRATPSNASAPLPPIAIDKPHLQAVAIKVDVTNNKSGKVKEEMVWFPRSQIKIGAVPLWLVGKKREELEAKHKNSLFDGLPE